MNDIEIFDALDRLSDFVYLKDEIAKKKDQIREINKKVCGNCDHWMKTSCIPEKKHGQFKSCDSIGCSMFKKCIFSIKTSLKFKVELKELESNIEKRLKNQLEINDDQPIIKDVFKNVNNR